MRPPHTTIRLLVFSLMFLGPRLVAGQSPVHFTPTGAVTGRLLSKDGNPAAGIRVSAVEALDPNGPSRIAAIVSSATTNSSGEYKVEDIPPGPYYITSGLVDLPTYYPGVADAGSATVVRVTGGATVSGINFAMAAGLGFSVSGRVVGSPGSPIAGPLATGTVMMISYDSMMMQQSRVKADGSFEFSMVRPGRYGLIMPFMSVLQQSSVITVVDKDVKGIEVVSPVLVSVTGRVTVAGGTTDSSPSFSLSFAGSNRVTASVLPDGKFQASLPAGEYRIAPSAIPEGYYLKSIVAGSTDLSQSPLKISGSSSAEIIVILGFQPAAAEMRK